MEIKKIIGSRSRTFKIELQAHDRGLVTDLYQALVREEFQANSSKLPAVYANIFKSMAAEPGIITKVVRIIGALLTGVNVETMEPDVNTDYNSYTNLFKDLADIQSFRLTALSTMSYLHMELVNNFAQMSNGVQKHATSLASGISLVQKILSTSLSAVAEIDTATLNPNEEALLTIVLKKLKYNDPQKPSVGAIVKIKTEIESGDVLMQDLIDGIKFKLAGLSDSNVIVKDELEKLIDYVNVAVTLTDKLSALSIECDNLHGNFAKSVEEIKHSIAGFAEKNTIRYNLSQHDMDNLIHLTRYFNVGTIADNNKTGVTTYSLSSNIVKKQIDLFNVCHRTLDKNGSDVNTASSYSTLFSTRSSLERVKSDLNKNYGLNEYKIEFFDGVISLPDHNKDISDRVQSVIEQSNNKNTPLRLSTILGQLNTTHDDDETNMEMQNAYKFYLNMYQYNLLGMHLAKFYIGHYFKLEDFKQYFEASVDQIIAINKDKEKQNEISNSSHKFEAEFDKLDKRYSNYLNDTNKVLKDYTIVRGDSSPINDLLLKTQLRIQSSEWQTRNVRTHEWIIKTLNIVHLLEKIKDNDIPAMRMVLHVEAVFDYIEMFYSSEKLPKQFMELRASLQSMYAANYDNVRSEQLKDVSKDLEAFVKFIHSESDGILIKILNAIIGLFSRNIPKDDLTQKIKNGMLVLEEMWVDVFEELNKTLNDYDEDVKICQQYTDSVRNNGNQLKDMKQLPRFNLDLESWSKSQLYAGNSLKAGQAADEIAKLIETHWCEFADLSKNQPDAFESICKIEFMQKAIAKYLANNDLGVSNHSQKDFKEILIFRQLLSDGNLSGLVAQNKEHQELLLKFLKFNERKVEFNKLVLDKLSIDQFCLKEFNEDVFAYLDGNGGAFVAEFSYILNRLKDYGCAEVTYDNLCKTFAIEKICTRFQSEQHETNDGFILLYKTLHDQYGSKIAEVTFKTHELNLTIIKNEFKDEIKQLNIVIDHNPSKDIVLQCLTYRANGKDYNKERHGKYVEKYKNIDIMLYSESYSALNIRSQIMGFMEKGAIFQAVKVFKEKVGERLITDDIEIQCGDIRYAFTENGLIINLLQNLSEVATITKLSIGFGYESFTDKNVSAQLTNSWWLQLASKRGGSVTLCVNNVTVPFLFNSSEKIFKSEKVVLDGVGDVYWLLDDVNGNELTVTVVPVSLPKLYRLGNLDDLPDNIASEIKKKQAKYVNELLQSVLRSAFQIKIKKNNHSKIEEVGDNKKRSDSIQGEDLAKLVQKQGGIGSVPGVYSSENGITPNWMVQKVNSTDFSDEIVLEIEKEETLIDIVNLRRENAVIKHGLVVLCKGVVYIVSEKGAITYSDIGDQCEVVSSKSVYTKTTGKLANLAKQVIYVMTGLIDGSTTTKHTGSQKILGIGGNKNKVLVINSITTIIDAHFKFVAEGNFNYTYNELLQKCNLSNGNIPVSLFHEHKEVFNNIGINIDSLLGGNEFDGNEVAPGLMQSMIQR